MQSQDHGNYFESAGNQRQSLRSSIKRSFSEKSLNRGVEYTRSPMVERVRIQNLNDNDNGYSSHQSSYQLNSRNTPYRLNGVDNITVGQSLGESRSYSAKLFPDDGYDKEIQELSMYFDSKNHRSRES
jgi:hypothetical protein